MLACNKHTQGAPRPAWSSLAVDVQRAARCTCCQQVDPWPPRLYLLAMAPLSKLATKEDSFVICGMEVAHLHKALGLLVLGSICYVMAFGMMAREAETFWMALHFALSCSSLQFRVPNKSVVHVMDSLYRLQVLAFTARSVLVILVEVWVPVFFPTSTRLLPSFCCCCLVGVIVWYSTKQCSGVVVDRWPPTRWRVAANYMA